MSSTRDAELALLIAEQERDDTYSLWQRAVSLDKPLGDDADGGAFHDVVGRDDAELLELLGEEPDSVRLLGKQETGPSDREVRSWRWARARRKWTYRQIGEHFEVSADVVRYHLTKRRPPQSAAFAALSARFDVTKHAYEQGARLMDIAEEIYEEVGYGSAATCRNYLLQLFIDRGVTRRPGRLTHGLRRKTSTTADHTEYARRYYEPRRERLGIKRCEQRTKAGRRCRRWGIDGICGVHARHVRGPLKWTPDRVIGALQDWTERHRREPTTKEWTRSEDGHPNFKTVYNLFGSWPAALEAARASSPLSGEARK